MSFGFFDVWGRRYSQSVGADEKLKISDNGNSNFVIHALRSYILFALLYKKAK